MDTLIQIREALILHPLFSVGVLLLLGFYFAKFLERFKLPEVTGYIITGLILGSSGLGIVSLHHTHSLQFITEIALGMIAITIGGEFSFDKLKTMGKDVLIMATLEVIGAFVLVTLGALAMGLALPFALLLGAIASATAPAATVAIVQGLGVKGKFIDYLYGIVALDDAGAVLLFGLAFGVAGALLGTGGVVISILHAVGEVVFSIIFGLIIGFLIHFALRFISKSGETLVLLLAFLFLSISIATRLHLSPLLANMVAGAVLINISKRNSRVFKTFQSVSPPVYALFFLVAGTELRPSIMFDESILALGVVYIITRGIGKYAGVWIGCKIAGTDGKTRKNLGFCLMPQAGVALGLAMMIEASPLRETLPAHKQVIIDNIINIILFSVFINELFGPAISRFGILRGIGLIKETKKKEKRTKKKKEKGFTFEINELASDVSLIAKRNGLISSEYSVKLRNAMVIEFEKVCAKMGRSVLGTIKILNKDELVVLLYEGMHFNKIIERGEYFGKPREKWQVQDSFNAKHIDDQIRKGMENIAETSAKRLIDRKKGIVPTTDLNTSTNPRSL
jgi:Kef-type K+ transport system membrane component KefB